MSRRDQYKWDSLEKIKEERKKEKTRLPTHPDSVCAPAIVVIPPDKPKLIFILSLNCNKHVYIMKSLDTVTNHKYQWPLLHCNDNHEIKSHIILFFFQVIYFFLISYFFFSSSKWLCLTSISCTGQLRDSKDSEKYTKHSWTSSLRWWT